MSLRTFHSNGLDAIVGYNPELDGYFLSIGSKEDGALEYLDDLSLGGIEHSLNEYEMLAPPSLFMDLVQDRIDEGAAHRDYIRHDYDFTT